MFKGSGFYQTDYRSDSYKKAAAAEKKEGKSGTSKSEKSGGTKDKKASQSAATAST
jgi:hypothetical protein